MVGVIVVSASGLKRLMALSFVLLLFFHALTLFSIFVLGHDYARGFVPLFNFDQEQNIPTFFSCGILAIASILLFSIAENDTRLPPVMRKYWKALGAIFMLLSIDEFSSIHEKISPIISVLFGVSGPLFKYSWVIMAGALIIVLGVAYLRFLLRLPVYTRLRFVVAGILFVGGAVGVEVAEAFYATQDNPYIALAILTTIQESLEMIGVMVFVVALLQYLQETANGVINVRLID